MMLLISKKTDPLDFIIDNTNIYYYTQAESAAVLILVYYKIDKNNFIDGNKLKFLIIDIMLRH